MKSWFECALSGATVIVPSERMARELRIEYSRRRSLDNTIWAAPHIVAFRQWTLARWADCLPDLQLLHPAQELALHRYVLEADGLGERVVADIYDSMGAVSSTPSFIVLSGGQGSVLRGSRPAEDFVNLLREVLDTAESGE